MAFRTPSSEPLPGVAFIPNISPRSAPGDPPLLVRSGDFSACCQSGRAAENPEQRPVRALTVCCGERVELEGRGAAKRQRVRKKGGQADVLEKRPARAHGSSPTRTHDIPTSYEVPDALLFLHKKTKKKRCVCHHKAVLPHVLASRAPLSRPLQAMASLTFCRLGHCRRRRRPARALASSRHELGFVGARHAETTLAAFAVF